MVNDGTRIEGINLIYAEYSTQVLPIVKKIYRPLAVEANQIQFPKNVDPIWCYYMSSSRTNANGFDSATRDQTDKSILDDLARDISQNGYINPVWLQGKIDVREEQSTPDQSSDMILKKQKTTCERAKQQLPKGSAAPSACGCSSAPLKEPYTAQKFMKFEY